jgi:serine/threonine protein kinase
VSDTAEERAQALIGTTLCDRYELEALIGQGAMGAVFRARVRGGSEVAVKTLSLELMAGDASQRFLRESELVRGLQHRHVVRTLDAGLDTQAGLLFLVMPLLHGRDLDQVLEEVQALEPENAVRIARQAARGLAAAHRVGIIHRDVKPANLILDQEGDELVVRVCDFGIAKRIGGEESLTTTGSRLGTPDYVSPEQLKSSKHVNERTDVWSLGATLYQMLCGAPPFAHVEAVFDLMTAIMTEDAPPLQDRAPWIEGSLAVVVHRALRRDPQQRWATVMDFADALRPFAGGDERLDALRLQPVSSRTRNQLARRAELNTPTKQSSPPGPAPKTPPRQVDQAQKPRSKAREKSVHKAPATGGARSHRVHRGPARGKRTFTRIAVGLLFLAIAAGAIAFIAAGLSFEQARVKLLERYERATAAAATTRLLGATEVTAYVQVIPTGAKVMTRDGALPVVNGEVALRGAPGDTLEVILEHAGASRRFSVSLSGDGVATPSRLDLAR